MPLGSRFLRFGCLRRLIRLRFGHEYLQYVAKWSNTRWCRHVLEPDASTETSANEKATPKMRWLLVVTFEGTSPSHMSDQNLLNICRKNATVINALICSGQAADSFVR